MIDKIFIQKNVTKICESAFANCNNLQQVEIPEDSNLETTERHAFICLTMKSITIPKSVSKLEDGWCSYSVNLNEILISCALTTKIIVGKSDVKNEEFDVLAFVPCDIVEVEIPLQQCHKVIGKSDNYDVLILASQKIKEVEIPSFIKIISSDTFAYSFIHKIYIPPDVARICDGAFSKCQRLQRVAIPNDSQLQKTGNDAFMSCPIRSLFIPSKIDHIAMDAFAFCYLFLLIEIDGKCDVSEIGYSQLKCQYIMISANLRGKI